MIRNLQGFSNFNFISRHRLKSMWSRFKRKKPLTLSRWKRFFTPDGRLHNRGVGLLKKVRSRVSLSSIAFVKFDDSVFTKVYGIFIFLMFSCRALILASGQRCGHSFLECKYTHSYSITTTMYLLQLICYNEILTLFLVVC